MTLSLLQIVAASALIETIEKQCRDAIHSEQEEMRLRRMVVNACHAFKVPTLAERRPANDSSFDAQLELVASVLNADGALSLQNRGTQNG